MHNTQTAQQFVKPVSDEDDDWDYPMQLQVKAAGLPAPVSNSPASIFSAGFLQWVIAEMPRSEAEQKHSETPKALWVDGVARVCGAAYPSNRWTPEKEEKERDRRARQKPPKPGKRARTTNGKIRLFEDTE